VRLTTLPCKKEIVEKPPRNAVGFCGGGHGLSWAVEPRKEEEYNEIHIPHETIHYSRKSKCLNIKLSPYGSHMGKINVYKICPNNQYPGQK
jgi:hypothetical protein